MRPGLAWPRLVALVLLAVETVIVLVLLGISTGLALTALVALVATAAVIMLDIARTGDDRG